MVESMREGSIIVDLATERGGNCELSQPGKATSHAGVTIIGYTNWPGRVPGNASALYANNLRNFLKLMLKEEGKPDIDREDEIIAGTCVTFEGEIVHPMLTKEG